MSACEKVTIFDTTLRDGEQSPGCSMTSQEKLRMAKQLDRLNVDVIEAGFPVSSDGDFQAVQAIARDLRRPVIAALARSRMEDIECAWRAVKDASRPRIHVFLATSDIHLQHKLKMTRRECLEQARDAVRYARTLCHDVEFSPEDATRSHVEFLCQVLEAVVEAGATTLNIPDTVGYTVPSEFSELISEIRRRVKGIERVVISAHCHDDLGMATANSLAAVSAGARQVECTVNGIGERAGNASLEEFVMALRVRADRFGYGTAIAHEQLYPTSQLLTEITGIPVQPNKAIVGRNAFAHEAGIHQDGMIKHAQTYEIMTPESVGVPGTSFVLGKHSGRHALGLRCEQLGFNLDRRALDYLYRKFVAVADRCKTVDDAQIAKLIAEVTHHSSTRTLSLDGVSTGVPEVAPVSLYAQLSRKDTASSSPIHGAFANEHDGEQEDYLWGV